jgi:transcriptional regulator with XRE-family HTH domain
MATDLSSSFGISIRQRREHANITRLQLANAIRMTLATLDAIESGQRQATDAQKQALLLAVMRLSGRSRLESHPASCMCSSCERTGGGDFAVRAFMGGDNSAAARLSAAVVAALSSQRRHSPPRDSSLPTELS